jgi:hypothetical protein
MRRGMVVLLAGLLLMPAAQAALVGVTLQSSPDITSGFLQVNYLAGTGAFSVSGFALTLETPPAEAPPDFNITNGPFTINLVLGPTGSLTSGNITVGGSIPALSASGPLLTGTATAFGFMGPPTGGSLFDFKFNVTGGSLGAYYPVGSQLGVIMHAVTSFGGSFAANYANDGSGSADAALLVPEPTSLALLLLGLTALRRR